MASPTDPPLDLTGTDLARDPAARPFRRLSTEVTVEFAAGPGHLATLEGPVSFQAGDALVTGTAGERWPIRAATFRQSYDLVAPARDGTPARYRRRVTRAWARRYDVAFSIRIRDGQDVLRGQPGDWLVQHEPGRYAVVAGRIFAATYAPDGG